jgi:hypothetical protein
MHPSLDFYALVSLPESSFRYVVTTAKLRFQRLATLRKSGNLGHQI